MARNGIVYIALLGKPEVRLYPVTAKKRIPDMPHFFNHATDVVKWYSDGKQLYLHIVETRERSAFKKDLKLKQKLDHWYAVER